MKLFPTQIFNRVCGFVFHTTFGSKSLVTPFPTKLHSKFHAHHQLPNRSKELGFSNLLLLGAQLLVSLKNGNRHHEASIVHHQRVNLSVTQHRAYDTLLAPRLEP